MDGKIKGRMALLVAGVLSIAYVIYLISYFFGLTTTSADTTEEIGSALATALVAPHIILVTLAVVFNWLAFFVKVPGFALTAGILYCVGGLIFIMYFPFVLVQMILVFVAYARMKSSKRAITAGDAQQPINDQ